MKSMEDARAATAEGLGRYMGVCTQEKYKFLQEITNQSIFEKKYIRKSYLQEILTTTIHSYLTADAVLPLYNIRKPSYFKITQTPKALKNASSISPAVITSRKTLR